MLTEYMGTHEHLLSPYAQECGGYMFPTSKSVQGVFETEGLIQSVFWNRF